MKNLIKTSIMLLALWTLSACERGNQPGNDPRQAFVGEYDFTSSGSVDVYVGAVKMGSLPMNEKGTMSISTATEPNEVWVIAKEDSTLAHVSGNFLFMDPTSKVETFRSIDLNLSFTYGKATLSHDTLSFPTDVTISATYEDKSISGTGHVDIVAVKK